MTPNNQSSEYDAMKRSFAVLSLMGILLMSGCSEKREDEDISSEPDASSSVWTDSQDGKLSLRLATPEPVFDRDVPITVFAELRNNSIEPVSVLRPFADKNRVMVNGLTLTGPQGKIPFTGGIPSYPVSWECFTEIGPGESIVEWIELSVEDFPASTATGQYSVQYAYASGEGHREAAHRVGQDDLWTGGISTGAVKVEKQEPTTSGVERAIAIQFPQDEYELTLAEVAGGVAFEYRILVREGIDNIVPQPQDTGGSEGPGPSGMYPFEEISGNGQSYSLLDLGLGCGAFPPQRLESGSHMISFDWDGRNWGGPSDTDMPKGAPFPPGEYTLTVSVAGLLILEGGAQPYKVSGSATVRLTE